MLGANVNLRAAGGGTALTYALAHMNHAAVQVLKAAGNCTTFRNTFRILGAALSSPRKKTFCMPLKTRLQDSLFHLTESVIFLTSKVLITEVVFTLQFFEAFFPAALYNWE